MHLSPVKRGNITTQLFRLLLVCALPILARAADTNPPVTVESLTAEMNKAMDAARVIINRPVRRLALAPGMQPGHYPYWFHDGATRPSFSTVDVRQSQEFAYDKFTYVECDLNPGVVFVGRELEFNSMTKFFYTDRSLPKRKLTQAEMVEINRLYRIIGECEQEIAELAHPNVVEVVSKTSEQLDTPDRPLTVVERLKTRSKYLYAVGGLVLFLVLFRWFQNRSAN